MKEIVSCATVSKTNVSGYTDVAQAVTGVILALFTLTHSLFVGTVLISPKLMDNLGWLLEVTFLAHIVAPLILLIMLVHFLIAARKMPVRLGELQVMIHHAKRMKHCDTWLWLVQVATAIIVLVLVCIHIYNIAMNFPITSEVSALRAQSGGWIFYPVLLFCVGLHLVIGLFRVGVKYGFIKAEQRELWTKRMWILLGVYCALGLMSTIRFHFIAI